MTQSDQIREDLHFVRQVVAGNGQFRFTAPYYIWAVYCLIGYCLLDINVHWANWFFLIGWFPAGMAIGIARRLWVQKHGELNESLTKKARQHFMFGGLLSLAAVFGLAICVPGFQGPMTGQVAVILSGIIYFLAGVHFDRSFLWLGPVVIVGGIVVGFVPHHGWSALGVVMAGGLCAAALLNSRRQRLLAIEE
jgi:hypothetical protein